MLKKSSFKNQLEKLIQIPPNHTYLLAVSGGADSMTLAFLFQHFRLKFEIAHINYKLRGKDSDSDQDVVQNFCEKNHIKFHLYEVSEEDNKPQNSIQVWARELRYTFFKHVQEKENLEFLVTAHHLNDQLETFIINLSKAAGLSGLSGIPSNDHNILRPLLSFTKDEIYQFAKEHHIEYREDLSNKKNDYLRNKIRNEIVPKLVETNEHFLENFKKSSSYLNQTKEFVQKQIVEIEKQLTTFNEDHIILSKNKLIQESDFVKFEILRKYGFTHEKEIVKIFSAASGSSFFSKDFQLTIHREQLIIINTNKETEIRNEYMLIENNDVSQNQMTINLENIMEEIEEINTIFEWDFDAEKLQFPLRLRRQHNGDEFYPSGFSGKKKVSKFFRDEKLSILARQKIWILTDSSNSILGIIPLRQDRRKARNEETNRILKIFNKK
ncbi:tRNA lysidine(34) synthetase TilS [Chryseobacterium fistulae]|uniref:tRNA lysidine(34) synthetase TilS n=1 Tax=Chryseobacterium fistulae TaxID=2675058 RepID=UPI00374281CB